MGRQTNPYEDHGAGGEVHEVVWSAAERFRHRNQLFRVVVDRSERVVGPIGVDGGSNVSDRQDRGLA